MNSQLTAAQCSVSSIMTKDFEVVRDNLDVKRLTKRLLARKVSCAAVSDGSGDLIGFVSMNDLVRDGVDRTATTAGASPVVVRDIMLPDGVLRIEADASIAEAAGLMAREAVHRLIVVADMRVVGMVSALDVLAWLARTNGMMIEYASTG
jgi:predicted transcriptional regulator